MNNNQQAFFELLRAGLWSDQRSVQEFKSSIVQDSVNWEKVYQLAQEQSLQGLVLQGIDWFKVHDSGFTVPQVLLLQWIGEVQIIEQQNKTLNTYINSLTKRLEKENVKTILVKGQGVAQCYERPYWHVSGDVDLILDEDNYKRGKLVLSEMASLEHEENLFDKHYSAEVDGFCVELHGTMRGMLTKKADDFIDKLQVDLFKNNRFREWDNDGTVVKLPCPDDDVLFVFTHILKHFFNYGIGLRQVCDWCRLLYTFRDSLDYGLLESRLCKMELMTEWKVFYNLASRYLGMPDLDSRLTCVESATSRHSSNKFGSAHDSIADFMVCDSRFDKKADRVLAFILETGNFGHNRDNNYYNNTNAIVRGVISLWRHTCDSVKHSFIFPVDSIKIWYRVFVLGTKDALGGIIRKCQR